MSDEIKTLQQEIKDSFSQFKEEHTKLLKGKADGKAVSDLTEKVEKINSDIDAKMERLSKIEAALKRAPQGNEAEKADVNEKVLRKAFRQWMSKGQANSTLSDAIMGVAR